jgi:tyrosine-protein kinase
LLDADLRRPSIHKFFEMENDRGLVDLILDHTAISDVLQCQGEGKVTVLTAGETAPNPTEILSSKKMDQVLSKLEEVCDVVIIDGPPFIVADASVLASKVDGVLLIARPGHTRRSLALRALEQIKLSGASVVGVVLNRIPLRGADYYAGKGYRYTYYMSQYGDERHRDDGKIDLDKLREILLVNANKVTQSIKQLVEAVSKPNAK